MTFVLNLDEDVVAQKPVADTSLPACIDAIAMSNGVDDRFVQAVLAELATHHE